MRVRTSVAAVMLAALLATSCSSAARPTSAVLLSSPGSGYQLNRASGPLTAQSLAVATALPQSAMTGYLRSVRLRSASERIWTSRDDGFVTDVVIDVGDASSAGRLVAVAGSVLPGPATQGFALGVGDGRGFVQTSDVRGQTMFCVIAFFTSGARAFIVTRCTPYPQDTTTVTRLARDQLTRAR